MPIPPRSFRPSAADGGTARTFPERQKASGMIKRLKRILVVSAIGLALCAVGIWVLTRVLEEGASRYQGQFLDYWLQRAKGQEPAASNQARPVLGRDAKNGGEGE